MRGLKKDVIKRAKQLFRYLWEEYLRQRQLQSENIPKQKMNLVCLKNSKEVEVLSEEVSSSRKDQRMGMT